MVVPKTLEVRTETRIDVETNADLRLEDNPGGTGVDSTGIDDCCNGVDCP